MHLHDRRRSRWLSATATAMAVALPGSVLALTQAPAIVQVHLNPLMMCAVQIHGTSTRQLRLIQSGQRQSHVEAMKPLPKES